MFGERSCIISVAELVEAPEVMINSLRGLLFPNADTQTVRPYNLLHATCDF
jgi:hypothetical protein